MRKKHLRCIYPSYDEPPDDESLDLECGKPAVKAHSIQNGGTLGELCEANHVYMLRGKSPLEYDPEMPEFGKVGRNKATTFTGLCNKHDTKLFLPIESRPLDLSDPKHVFLLTYRSALRAAHSAIENARWSSEAARKLSEEGYAGPYDGTSDRTL